MMTDKEKSKAAKRCLSRIASTDALIRQLEQSVSCLRSSLTSQNYTLNPNKVQTSVTDNTMADTINRIADCEADINRRVGELTALKRETMERIGKLPDLEQQTLLIGRYVNLKPWMLLATEMNYSVQHLYRLHGKALLAFFDAMSKIESL